MKQLLAFNIFLLIILINHQLFADFPIRQSTNWDGGSVIAYNSTDHEYLVAWIEAIPVLGGYLQQVKGQRIAENGSMIGSVFTIFTGGTLPSIVYNPEINEYLVVLCKPELCGQRVSNTGTLIGSQILYNTSAANSQILYNSLAGTYLLIGSEKPPFNQLFTRKISSDGQPLGAIQNIGNSTEFSAAYAPISSPETPYGRYLLFTGVPYMLDSDGNLIYTVTDNYGVKHPGIPFSWGIGEHFGFDVAYGGSTFIVVWADKTHFSQALKDIRCESSGIWGSYIDPYELDYTSDYVIQDKSFPITRICDHQETNDANGEFIASWNPKVTYSNPGQKFMVTWRETPMSFNYDDATVNHIRANSVSGAIPPSVNTVISITNGNENPKNPAIAASTLNPNALIIWEDARDSASTNINIYGNLFSIPAAPSITVVQPNGGENWKAATQHEIKWTSKNFTDPVMIEYSTDGGSSYASITNSTTNDGSYMWTVPYKPSEFCIIRIKDASDGNPADISDGVFSIYGNTQKVSNINDTGPGSFRQAILDANANPGKDTIVFNIPGTEVHTIQPLSQLPEITDPVVIDGYTQPGSSQNTNPIASGSNAVIKIEIDQGSDNWESSCGLYISAGNSVVRGIAVNRFWIGIYLDDKGGNTIEGNFVGTNTAGTAKKEMAYGIVITSSNNLIGGITASSRNLISGNHRGIDISNVMNLIQGNFIGTDVTGTNILANETGIVLNGDNNTVGGLNIEARNIISGNTSSGIQIGNNQWLVKDNKILGNFIGSDLNGINALPNRCGIWMYTGNSSTTIGGIVSGSCNLISGNTENGIEFYYGSGNNKIEGNLIGTQLDGISPLGNGKYGICMSIAFTNSTIGGLTANAANTIAYNGSHGIYIANLSIGLSQPCIGNRIYGNSIFSNGGLGINLIPSNNDDGETANDVYDADSGSNNLQNYPVLISVENDAVTNVSGYLNSTPNTKYRIDFYSNSAPDPSGYGEGENHITWTEVTTSKDGNINFNTSLGIKVPDNYYLTATATDLDGNTSEFSNSISVLPNTTTGVKVKSNAWNGTKITFDKITASGFTTSTSYVGGPPVPNGCVGFPLGSPIYYSINTTASYTGNIELGIQYNDSGLTEAEESKLKLNVYESEQWKDITSSVDVDSNVIYGITTHLSDFVIALPSSGPLNILVTSTQDTGVGSLRNALQLAAENPGTDTILFNIPQSDTNYNSSLGVWTLRPTITYDIPKNTVVDARIFTAPDTSKPGIEIDGIILKQSGMTGIWLYEGAEIHGLIVNNCQYGIWIAGPNAKVENCFIGTDPSGDFAKPNGLDGILVTDGSTNVVIQNNLISGNSSSGIRLFGENTTNDTIRYNLIGTNFNGTKAVPNGDDGIEMHAGVFKNLVEGNLVSGNIQCGIHLLDSATNCNIIRENMIGTNASGSDPIPNGTFGVALFNGPSNNIIGPDNFVAYNTQYGILIDGSDSFFSTTGNTVTANRITANGMEGICNFRGGNAELIPPAINSFANYLVSGKAAPGQRIEIFVGEDDEGFFLVGEDTTDLSGNFSHQLPIQFPSMPNLLATAIDSAGNTSEFSQPFVITSVKESPKKIIPAEFKLYQNYPNPFNPSTNIIYHLAGQSHVTLIIYDILGNEIGTLVNEEKSAGVYNIYLNTKVINNKGISSGVYFYQLRAVQSGGLDKVFVSTKKFVLLK